MNRLADPAPRREHVLRVSLRRRDADALGALAHEWRMTRGEAAAQLVGEALEARAGDMSIGENVEQLGENTAATGNRRSTIEQATGDRVKGYR